MKIVGVALESPWKLLVFMPRRKEEKSPLTYIIYQQLAEVQHFIQNDLVFYLEHEL